MLGIAFVGCGFVADFYMRSLAGHPQLRLVGVTDRDPVRLEKFSRHHGVKTYSDLGALLSDPEIDLVLNLTNPRSHFDVSRQCLLAGKHVYSEKPLGMTLSESSELVGLAKSKGLLIASAPCSILGETAQTVWKALRDTRVGDVRVVYAEMDDGMVHLMPHQHWVSESGAVWPAKDEFEIGCTIEHAGYYVTWLTAFFGPATFVQSFAAALIPDKKMGELSPPDAPDFSVACIRFASGVVARLTCSIIAPHDHRLLVVGEQGILRIKDCWYYDSPVYLQKYMRVRRRMFLNPFKTRIRPAKAPNKGRYGGSHRMDFCRGVAEMAAALAEKRPCRLSNDFSLHNNELVLAISDSSNANGYRMTTSFETIAPAEWAQ